MIFNVFRRLLSWQLSGLVYSLDPIAIPNESAIVPEVEVDQPASPPSSKWNLYFIIPFLCIFLSTIHGNLWLPYSAGIPLTWASLSSSPALLYRQVFPRKMWAQTDFVAVIAVLGGLAIYGSFWRRPWTLQRYVILERTQKCPFPILCLGSSAFSPHSSLKILKTHRRIQKVSFTTYLGAVLFADIFILGNALLNGFYSLTNGHYLVSLLLLFLFSIAVLYALLGITTFLILASVCIQIRQKDVIHAFSALNDKLKFLKGKEKRLPRKLTQFRAQNRQLNRTVLSIVSQLEGYATYWTPALSLLFLIYTTWQTFLAYPVFFTENIIFLQKAIFLYLVIEIDVALFYLINVCARVVQLNRRIEVVNRDFYLLMAAKGAFGAKNICQQLKCEALAVSHRLRPYAFHLFDNYRITSRTFYMVFSNIALFFLLVVKHSL